TCSSSRSAASATAAARCCWTLASQGSGPSCGSWASASSPTSGSARRPGPARCRRETRRGPPSPSASSPSSAGWRSL
uniref:Synaptogyrin 3 n=1 Tax=Lynx canadensis TaxID=61383 RepID=A0A667I6P6_LYNCA